VELREVMPLAQVRVWNRSDSDTSAKRAAQFQVLLSNEGKRGRLISTTAQSSSATTCRTVIRWW
jgi:hypothetical protein